MYGTFKHNRPCDGKCDCCELINGGNTVMLTKILNEAHHRSRTTAASGSASNAPSPGS